MSDEWDEPHEAPLQTEYVEARRAGQLSPAVMAVQHVPLPPSRPPRQSRVVEAGMPPWVALLIVLAALGLAGLTALAVLG